MENEGLKKEQEQVNQIFNEYGNDIQLYLKKYKDIYAQSIQSERKTIDELDTFHGTLLEHEQFLKMKLANFKKRIADFEKSVANENEKTFSQ